MGNTNYFFETSNSSAIRLSFLAKKYDLLVLTVSVVFPKTRKAVVIKMDTK